MNIGFNLIIRRIFFHQTGRVQDKPFRRSWNRTLACLLTDEEHLQLFDDDAVQKGLRRLAGNIFEGGVKHGEALRSSAKRL